MGSELVIPCEEHLICYDACFVTSSGFQGALRLFVEVPDLFVVVTTYFRGLLQVSVWQCYVTEKKFTRKGYFNMLLSQETNMLRYCREEYVDVHTRFVRYWNAWLMASLRVRLQILLRCGAVVFGTSPLADHPWLPLLFTQALCHSIIPTYFGSFVSRPFVGAHTHPAHLLPSSGSNLESSESCGTALHQRCALTGT